LGIVCTHHPSPLDGIDGTVQFSSLADEAGTAVYTVPFLHGAKAMLRNSCTSSFILVFALSAFAADEDAKLAGIPVGEKAPDFELRDQLDKPIKLSTLLKKGPVAVVFHRSASW